MTKNSIQNLSALIEKKQQKDKAIMAAETQKLLQKHESNSKKTLSAEQSALKKSIQATRENIETQIQSLQQLTRSVLLKSLLLFVPVALSLACLLGANWYLATQIKTQITTLSQLQGLSASMTEDHALVILAPGEVTAEKTRSGTLLHIHLKE